MERPTPPRQEPWAPERRGKCLPQGAGTGSCPARRHGHSPGLEALTNSHGAFARFPGSLCKPQAPESSQEHVRPGQVSPNPFAGGTSSGRLQTSPRQFLPSSIPMVTLET